MTGESIVFLVREGKAQARAVVTGTDRQGQVVIKEGSRGARPSC